MPGSSRWRLALAFLATAAIVGGALLHVNLVYPMADVEGDREVDGNCTPRLSVGFLKTHKCASSSIQNIMLRFGERRGLSFVLPPASNYLGHPKPFHRSMAPALANRSGYFDLLVHHARFNEQEMRHVLAPGAKFVTIVREPAELFESLYSYYDLVKQFRVSLDRVTNSSLVWVRKRLARKPLDKLGLNQMSFDLGLEPFQFNDLEAVHRFIRHLDSAFDLVLVAERMRESLVLLKDLLCWSMDDVVAFKHNARAAPFRRPLDPQGRARLRELNAADAFLYEHFAKRMDDRVRDFGSERMQRELRHLDERTSFWYSRCVGGIQPVRRLMKGVSTQKRKYWTNAKVVGFQAKDSRSKECHGFLAQELVFTDEIRKRQKQTLPTRKPLVATAKKNSTRS